MPGEVTTASVVTSPSPAVVLSGERHYFGFGVRPLLDVLQAHTPCRTRLRRRCDKHAVYQLDYAYVRERDMRPTHCTDMACREHAQEFADEWGLGSLPDA